MPSPNNQVSNWSEKFGTETTAFVGSLKPSVFIMGPAMHAESGGVITRGAALRKELVNRCEQQGLDVLAEHKKVERKARRLAKKLLLKYFNLADYELLVAEQCDVVAIIPDSPGSFAELGCFAMMPNICKKLLILFPNNNKNSRSYVLEGPRKAAEFRKATVEFVEYDNPEPAWNLLSDAIDNARVMMISSRLIDEGKRR